MYLGDGRQDLVRSTLDHVQGPLDREEAVGVLHLPEGYEAYPLDQRERRQNPQKLRV